MARLTVGTENGAPIDLHYEDHGAGSPVVLIHGWPLSGRAWEQQIPALVDAGHRVITYDRRGFGESSQPWTGYEYDTFTADLDALLIHLDLRDVTLVGFSMGGGEVARYVGRYGTARVSRVVFAAAVTPYLYETADNPEGGIDDAGIAGMEHGVLEDRIAFLDTFATNYFSVAGELLVSPASHRYHRTIAEFASPKGTLACVSLFGRTDFRDDLTKIAAAGVPALVVHGDADEVVAWDASGRRTHEALPGSTAVLVEGAPHGLNATHPGQFNQALLTFLDS